MTNRNDVRIRLEDAIDALTATVRRNTDGKNALDPTPPTLGDVENARGAIRTLVEGLLVQRDKALLLARMAEPAMKEATNWRTSLAVLLSSAEKQGGK